MKRQQFILLLVLLVVLGGGALVLFQRSQSSWNQSGEGVGQKTLGDFDVNAVAQITIRKGSNEVNLVRANDAWVVKERENFPASFDEIREALRKAADLKAVQTIKVGPSQRPRLELTEPSATDTNSGTLVEFKDSGGKLLKGFLLGKTYVKQGGQASPFGGEDGFPAGRYLLPLPAGELVSIVSEPLNNLEPSPGLWLNKDFVKIEKVKSLALTSAGGSNSWQVSRSSETNAWILADSRPEEKLSPGRATDVAGALASASFTDVVVGKPPAETGLDQPSKATFTTFDGFTYDVSVGKVMDESYPVTVSVSASLPQARTPAADEKAEDKEKLDKEFKEQSAKLEEKLKKEKIFSGRTFLVSKWTIDALLKNRSELLEEKKAEEPKPAEPVAP